MTIDTPSIAKAGDGSLRLNSWRDCTGKAVPAEFIASSGISVPAEFSEGDDEMFRTVRDAAHRCGPLIA